MTRTRPLTLTLILAGILTGLAWWLASGGEERGAVGIPGAATSEAFAAAPSGQELAPVAPVAGSADREILERGREAVAAEASDIEAVLRGRAVDGRGRGVEGAEVEARHAPASTFDYLLDEEYHRERVPAASTRTATDGTFALKLPALRPHELRVRAEGFADALVEDVYAGQTVTVRLRAGASVSGAVSAAIDGAPVAGARVMLLRESGGGPAWDGLTDAGGGYAAEGLDPGRYHLQVIPEAERATGFGIDLREGDRVVRDVRVEAGSASTGLVKDATSGRPIPEAEVSAWDFRGKNVRTDASGRFSIGGLPDRPVVSLAARAVGYGRNEVLVELKPGAVAEVEIGLARALSAGGRVVSREGRPIAGAYVAALALGTGRPAPGSDVVSARSGEDGRFEIANLRADMRHALFARHAGHGAVALDIGEREEGGGPVDLGDVVLPPASRLSGSVRTPDGAGVAGALVQLRSTTSGAPAWIASLCSRTLETDAEGRFGFADLGPGRHSMRIVAEGFPIVEAFEVDLGEGESRSDATVVVGDGLSIRGRVVDPFGLGVAGAEVWIPRASAGSAVLARAKTREDGVFLLAGLKPGRYELNAAFHGLYGAPADPIELLPGRAADVEAGARGVEIALPRALAIEGLVSSLGGQGLPGMWVLATDGRGSRAGIARTDEAGRFRIPIAGGAVVDLGAYPFRPDTSPRPEGAPPAQVPQAVVAGVHAGDREVVILVP